MNHNSPSPPIDPAIVAAQAAADAATPDTVAAIAPLHRDADALLAADPSNPHHALYLQALEGLEPLGPGQFKDRRERERVALAIALQAAAIGLARIDRVAANDAGSAYFFADAQAVDPAMRGQITHAEAVHPLTPQRLAETLRAQQQGAVIEQQQGTLAQQEAQRSEAVERQRRADPRQTREL